MRASDLADAATLGLALLAGSAAAQSSPVITVTPSPSEIALAAHLEHYWSYGRSPPVYPSPELSNDGDLPEAYNKG